MIKRLGGLSIASILALAEGVLVTPPVFASVPNPGPLEWKGITKTLNDQALPLAWHDARSNSIVYYHLHFGTEADAVRSCPGKWCMNRDSFSNTRVAQEQNQSELSQPINLTMATHGPYNKGFIVGLNDPVGITKDLSELKNLMLLSWRLTAVSQLAA